MSYLHFPSLYYNKYEGCDKNNMGSDYLFVIGIILLFQSKTIWIGILYILGACINRKRKTIKEKKHLVLEDL